MDAKEFRFSYFRDEKRFPVACLATKVDRSNNVVMVGLSTVHPLDRKSNYSKPRARNIAMGRAASNPFIVELDPEERSAHDILLAVIETLYDAEQTPRRVKKLLKRWLHDDEAKSYPTLEEAIAAVRATDPTITPSIQPPSSHLVEQAVSLQPEGQALA